MKKIACGIAVLGLLVFSAKAYTDDDTKTLIDIDEYEDVHDDAETVFEPSEEDNEKSVNERIKQQENLLIENKSGKNYNELKILYENGFVVTEESLADLERNFNNTVMKVDLFESVNTDSALIEAFNFAMNEDADANFISGEYNLPRDIKKNPELYNAMREFVQNLDNPSEKMTKNDIQVQNLESLKNIYSLLKKDKKIGENDVFSKFVKGMINVYKVIVARRVADEIMTKYRYSTEKGFSSKRKTSTAKVETKISSGALTGGSSAVHHTSEGFEASSFYTINVGNGVKMNVGVGTPSIGAKMGASLDETESAIFYSLEQLLDSGKVNSGIFSENDIKAVLFSENDIRSILKERQKMQKREKTLLSIFGTDVEGYLKMIGKIPVSTYLEWPKLTKSSPSSKTSSWSKSLEASAEVNFWAKMGFNAVASDDTKVWKIPSGYMTLISEDCSPSEGLSAADIVKFLGKQYDISETFGGKSDVNVIPIILGDIRDYNLALSSLAKNGSDKKASQRKHEIENRWLPEKEVSLTSAFKGSEGRLGILKSMIATVSTLRESAVTDRETELFKQLNIEMSRLAQLLEFSKNKSNRSATFETKTTAHNRAIKALASVKLPKFQLGGMNFHLEETDLSITRSFCRDNPFQEENGDFMYFDVVLPITPTGILGLDAVDKSLTAYDQFTEGTSALNYKGTFDLAKKGLKQAKGIIKNPKNFFTGVSAGFWGSGKLSIAMTRVDAPKPNSVAYPARIMSESESGITKARRPLPNKKFIERKGNQWVIWYVKGGAYLNSAMMASEYTEYAQKGADLLKIGMNVSKVLQTLDVEYTASLGKETVFIGTDTLSYLTARFNAFSLGLKDSKDAMSPWYAFKDNQKKSLTELLKNITDETSNVIYELQNMYNAVMNNIDERDTKTSERCTQLFKNFLSVCDDLDEAQDEESKEKAFEEASGLMDEIFRMNFDYNFMKDYRKAYQIKK